MGREKKKFCEALDGVEQLWKNYEADLKAKEDQIDQNIKDMKEMNEIILKLREERRKKDLAAKNEIKEKNEIILKYVMDNLKKDLATADEMKKMNETILKLKEDAERKDLAAERLLKASKDKMSELAKIEKNEEFTNVSNENKLLEKDNLELKESVRMKDVYVEKYKKDFKRIQSKISDFIMTKDSLQKAIKAKEMELDVKDKELKDNDAIINEAERKHQELSKLNSRFSVELENKTCIIKEKENEIENIHKKNQLRKEE